MACRQAVASSQEKGDTSEVSPHFIWTNSYVCEESNLSIEGSLQLSGPGLPNEWEYATRRILMEMGFELRVLARPRKDHLVGRCRAA